MTFLDDYLKSYAVAIVRETKKTIRVVRVVAKGLTLRRAEALADATTVPDGHVVRVFPPGFFEPVKCKPKRLPKRLRLGLFDPVLDAEVEFIGREFTNSPGDLDEMRLTISEFNRLSRKDPDVTLCLGVFPARQRRKTA